jgi:hypothetical protein
MPCHYMKYTFMQVQDTVDYNTDVVNMLSEKEKIVKLDLTVERAFRALYR